MRTGYGSGTRDTVSTPPGDRCRATAGRAGANDELGGRTNAVRVHLRSDICCDDSRYAGTGEAHDGDRTGTCAEEGTTGCSDP